MEKFFVFLIVFLATVLLIWTPRSWEDSSNAQDHVYQKATYLVPNRIVPADAISTAEHSISNLLYQGLFRVNGHLEVETDLVREWRFDQTKNSYLFVLSKNVKFSNGSVLTPEDYLDCLKYLFFSGKNSENYRMVRSVALDKNGNLELVVNDAKWPLLPLLASPQAKIWKFADKSAYPIGSGPYFVAKRKFDPNVLHLKKNEHFSGKLRPSLQQIDVVEMTETEARQNLAAGTIDDTVDIPISRKIAGLSSYREDITRTSSTWLIAFNTRSPSLKSIGRRKCLISRFNKKAFLERFVPTHEAATGYLPSSLPGSEIGSSGVDYNRCEETSGHTVRLTIPKEIEYADQMCSFFAREWSDTGLKINCSVLDFAEILKSIETGTHEAALLAMSLDFPSVESFLNPFETGSKFNLSAFTDSKIDGQLELSRHSDDKLEKYRAYSRINQILFENAVTLNISYPKLITYSSTCISGLQLSVAGTAFTDYSKVEWRRGCKN